MSQAEAVRRAAPRKHELLKRIVSCKYLYILLFPTLVYFAVFSYAPMYGAILAFKDFSYKLGIMGSHWTKDYGLYHFIRLFSILGFKTAFFNTLLISLGRLVFEFPVPIILALLFNEVHGKKYRKTVQTISTFPHFISWVIAYGVLYNLMNDQGIINQVLLAFGGSKVSLLTSQTAIRPLIFITNIVKEAGWGTIIYLAAISNVNPELFEAAIVDGAKRRHLALHITWPAIRTVVGIMMILQVANAMNAGFDQIFNVYNPSVYNKIDILDTFIYRLTFAADGTYNLDFASATAVGLFKSVINLVLLVIANFVTKRATGSGIY